MSKGSNFWGTARGKLGNMVISSVKGQQVERKYQPVVANPKTFAQMRQRAVFASAVKFFKHSQQNLFKFAYEDKTQKESDYNAFMRHNVKCFTPINKIACDNPTLPALGFWLDLQLSFGSLPSADNEQDFYESSQDFGFGLRVGQLTGEPEAPNKHTWGEVSQAIIKKFDLIDGDIITFVLVDPHMNMGRLTAQLINGVDASEASAPAKWWIEQKKIDSTSTEDVSSQIKGDDTIIMKDVTMSKPSTTILFGSVIFSRNTKGRALMVSTSIFTCSRGNYESNIVQEGSYREREVLLSWGANPEAILKGSLL